MRPTEQLRHAGQSLWLDNIRRALLTSGTLQRYITDSSITGLTSNPTIFEHAIKGSRDSRSPVPAKAFRRSKRPLLLACRST
jgi:transaldolase